MHGLFTKLRPFDKFLTDPFCFRIMILMTVLYTENNPASRVLVGDAVMSLKLVLIAPFLEFQL